MKDLDIIIIFYIVLFFSSSKVDLINLNMKKSTEIFIQ